MGRARLLFETVMSAPDKVEYIHLLCRVEEGVFGVGINSEQGHDLLTVKKSYTD